MIVTDTLDLSIGTQVVYAGEAFEIKSPLSLTSFLIQNCTSGEQVVAQLDELSPSVPVASPAHVHESDLATLSAREWEEAKRRAAVIRPLATLDEMPADRAKQAAEQLGLSQRTIYSLLQRYRASGGLLTSLARRQSAGGRGKGRLAPDQEMVIRATIAELYLSSQRHRAAEVVQEVRRRCHTAGLQAPSEKAIRARIDAIRPEESVRRRHGRQATHRLTPVQGAFPAVTTPLEVVQMDHTVVDCIIVDEHRRQPIGRPYITVGIDMYSRCITGFCLTLEAPSSVSVGLCLAHSVLDKETELRRLELEGEWPIWGKPGTIHVDNATEFYSEALSRGCQQHGIRIDHRPVRQPHYGGTIERVLGTLMQRVHSLPGTTFSNPQERGAYDSEGRATLTLKELEKWLTLVIVGHYHLSVHSTLHEPPIERFKRGLLGTHDAPGPGPRPRLVHRRAFLIDFLPLAKRKIQRHGFVLDHIQYYSNALRPWIAERDRLEPFLIRRDPRDLSRIFVLDPERQAYVEISYRMLNRPAMTLWEHHESVRRIKQEGRAKVDEAAIFRTLDKMREVTQTAQARTKAARRRQARLEGARAATTRTWSPAPDASPAPTAAEPLPFQAVPFDDIEEW
jgi:putative transposase